jgi:hypothetical protein
MSKKFLHQEVIDIPIYKGKLVILLSNSGKLVNSITPIFDKKEEVFATAIAGPYQEHQGYYVIFDPTHRIKLTAGCVAHEAVHLASYLFMDSGVHLDLGNDEPAAYLTEWFVDRIHEVLNKHEYKV